MSNVYPRLWDQLALSNLPQDDVKHQPNHTKAVKSNINTGQASEYENRASDVQHKNNIKHGTVTL